MTQHYWDKIADKEFDSLDAEIQAEWSDLRNRVNRHVFSKYLGN